MTVRVFQTNFSAGEVDPLMRARTDSAAHKNGAKKLRNVAMLTTGGIARRWGTRFTGSKLPGKARLVKWEFSAGERYVVALSATTATFYSEAGAQVAQLTGCPWSEAIVFQLRVAQAADTMILAHPTMQTQVIRRTGLTSFAREAFAFARSVNGNKVYQPYYKFASDDTTLTPSGATGSIVLLANGPVFEAGHVGTRFRWHGVEMEITAVASSTQATATVKGELKGRYDINPFRTTLGSDVIEVTHVAHGFVTNTVVTISGANAVAGIPAAEINGARQITVIDDNTYSFVANATPGTATPDPGTGGGSAGGDYNPNSGDGGGEGGAGTGGAGDGSGGDGGGGGGE